MPANLCIVVGCATKRARGYRDRRGKGGQLDVVCGTGLYRLGGTFLGLNQVRRVAGESDEDREVRLQALRTKKVLDPGSVPLELVVSVLVTVVSFTLTCFSSHLIVTGTDPCGDAHHVSLQTAPGSVLTQVYRLRPINGIGQLHERHKECKMHKLNVTSHPESRSAPAMYCVLRRKWNRQYLERRSA